MMKDTQTLLREALIRREREASEALRLRNEEELRATRKAKRTKFAVRIFIVLLFVLAGWWVGQYTEFLVIR